MWALHKQIFLWGINGIIYLCNDPNVKVGVNKKEKIIL